MEATRRRAGTAAVWRRCGGGVAVGWRWAGAALRRCSDGVEAADWLQRGGRMEAGYRGGDVEAVRGQGGGGPEAGGRSGGVAMTRGGGHGVAAAGVCVYCVV